MAAGTTYNAIATTTLTGSQSTISFNSISGSYTDLILVFTAIVTGGNDVYIQVNGDNSSNYCYVGVSGDGTNATSYKDNSLPAGILTDYFGTPSTASNSVTIVQFFNYSNTSTFKTIISRSNRASSGVDIVTSMWRSTSAINSFTMRFNDGTQFTTGTVVTLYGIAAA